jgi:hypothetical protein
MPPSIPSNEMNDEGERVFDKKTATSLLDINKNGLERVTGKGKNERKQKRTETLSNALGVDDLEMLNVVANTRRELEQEVEFLLGRIMRRGKGKLVRIGEKKLGQINGAFRAEDTIHSLADLASWKGTLVNELNAQGVDTQNVLDEKFDARNRKAKHRSNEEMRLKIEAALLADAISSRRENALGEVLEGEWSGDVHEVRDGVRAEMMGLLSVPRRKDWNFMAELDAIGAEVHDEQEEREYQLFASRIMSIFGRGSKKSTFLTVDLLSGLLKGENPAKIQWALGKLNSEGRVACLTGSDGEVVYIAREKGLVDYESEELQNRLHHAYFDQVGLFLKKAIDRGEVVDRAYLEDRELVVDLPSDVVKMILDCYVDLGQVQRKKNRGYQLTERAGNAAPSSMAFKRISLSGKFWELAKTLNDEQVGMDDARWEDAKPKEKWDMIHKQHEEWHNRRRVKDIEIETGKDRAKVAHVCEIQFGHKDLDTKALQEFVEALELLPEAERPDAVVITGILFGRFKHWDKDKHKIKVDEIDDQLKKAKFLLDQLKALGVPVIYNMGDNDAAIVKEYTYDAVGIMEDLMKGAKFNPDTGETDEGNGKRPSGHGVATKDRRTKGAAYFQFEQAQRSKAWPQHYKFQWEVVFEYMLRSGRHLRSPEDVHDICGEHIEEYLLLLYAYKALKEGKSLEELEKKGDKLAEIALNVLDVENIPYPAKKAEDNLTVVSNFNMCLKTTEGQHAWEEKHYFRQTPTSKVRDPLKEARADIAQRHVMNEDTPEVFAIDGEGHTVGSLESGRTIVMSTPGMHRTNKDDDGYTDVQSDENNRKVRARGERITPGMTPITLHDDGRVSVDFWNKKFLERAAKSTEERVRAVFFSDWQTGSVTSRPDLYVKSLDYVMHEVAQKHKTWLFFNGDIVQGRNYPEMPNENCDIGLVRTDDQTLFVEEVIRDVLAGASEKARRNIQGVVITPGNHEWNTGHKYYGSMHSQYLRSIFRDYLGSDGHINYAMYSPVRFEDEYFKSPTALEDIAGYKVLAQHIFAERGAKGSGGLPVYSFREILKGVGEKGKNIDIFGTGHFHHPSWHMVNDKVGFIAGSIAGISGYEWWRGYNPVLGTTIMHLGGDQPPTKEVLTKEALNNYDAQGTYSDKNLGRRGFSTDEGWNPATHGYGRLRINSDNDPDEIPQVKGLPQSAIQQALWDKTDTILRGVGSNDLS